MRIIESNNPHCQQRKTVIEVVLHRRVENSHGVIVQPVLERVGTESAKGDRQQATERSQGDKHFSHAKRGSDSHRGPQFLHGTLLELPDALGGHAVLAGQIVQGGFLLRQPALGQDIATALIEISQCRV